MPYPYAYFLFLHKLLRVILFPHQLNYRERSLISLGYASGRSVALVVRCFLVEFCRLGRNDTVAGFSARRARCLTAAGRRCFLPGRHSVNRKLSTRWGGESFTPPSTPCCGCPVISGANSLVPESHSAVLELFRRVFSLRGWTAKGAVLALFFRQA